jgi:RND superfamily putative drug exporter
VIVGSGVEVFIGGQTAVFEDIRDQITSRLPQFFGLVIGLSFLLLMIVFRSLVVPIKAAVMNLLAIGAAFGVLVAIFQWGWLAGPLGVGRPGPIESFAPMMLFAILFGLSMDYEVFLLSRVRENYVEGLSNREAVARGVGQTARVITAAAAIMVSVFLAFALSEGRTIKEFGLGLATAIFVDATIVRLVLVPATMGLLGDANWYFPRWLDRLLPRLQIEGAPAARAASEGAAASPPAAAEAGGETPSVVTRVLDAPRPEVNSDLRPVESEGAFELEPAPLESVTTVAPDSSQVDAEPEPVATGDGAAREGRRPPRDYMGGRPD